ncbi:MAG: hypothetical protein RBT37_00560 [Dissulfurispiraceae bacterium]|jgi:hypothetical protein|nr:hypothetical protein [Dissulfurispiraceae bacterium]
MSNASFQKLTKVFFTSIFLISIILIVSCYSETGANKLWSNASTFWLFIITSVLIFAIWHTNGIPYMITWFISYTMSIYYYPRFIGYAIFSDMIQFANIPDQISSSDITNMLMVLAVYLACIALILVIATIILNKKYSAFNSTPKSSQTLCVNKMGLILFCCIIIILEYTWINITGINVYASIRADSGHFLAMLIKLFLKSHVLFPIILYLLIKHENNEKIQFAYLILILMIFMISSSLWGSRIGPLRSLTYVLFLITFFANKVNLTKLILIIAIICTTACLTTPLANYIRVDRAYDSRVTSAYKNDSVSEQNRLTSIINRFGDSDFSTIVINKINHADPKLSVQYTVKSILNYIMPGMPFKEAPIQQSRMLPVLTGVVDWDYVVQPNTRYHSQPFTVWGQVYISGKLWVGSALLSLITSVIIFCGVFFNLIAKRYWQANLAVPYFYLILIYGFWNLMAWDQYISNAISLSLSFVFYFIVIVLMKIVAPKTEASCICR